MRVSCWEVLSLCYLLGNSGAARGHVSQLVLKQSNTNDGELSHESHALSNEWRGKEMVTTGNEEGRKKEGGMDERMKVEEKNRNINMKTKTAHLTREKQKLERRKERMKEK